MLDASTATETADHLAILIGLSPEKAVEDRETLFFSRARLHRSRRT